jgi:sugar fermentation stimulation protein A
MLYKKIEKGIFLERPNRFIAKVRVKGKEEMVHVKNTGRCKELLVKGCTVYLSVSDNPNRKTAYDLIAVEKYRENKAPLLVNMDSQIPNDVTEEFLKQGNIFSKKAVIKREVKYGDSRFDFYIEDGNKKAFLEVKGVTLEQGGIAMFPDAPTLRGIKHINELVRAKKEGYSAYILFVIQMKEVSLFKANAVTHKDFADALKYAKENGIKIIAMDCIVTENSIIIDSPVRVEI